MPDRGDIILFRLPKKIQKEDQGYSNDTSMGRKKIGLFRDENGEILIKRVVGLPGESILINKDGISIDGRQITKTLPVNYDLTALDNGYYAVDTPLKLGNNEIFVLGDNSSLSDDSRYWGPISRKYVVGRFVRILFREGPNGPNEKEVKKGEQN
jgi:signal peptidase I